MLSIDLNCDLGEGFENDASIMPFISSANISCGFHAGDKETMLRTIESAIENDVKIGAHPSFLDRPHFGRREMELPAGEVYNLVSEQIHLLSELVNSFGKNLQHIKPHGAMYNMAARDKSVAMEIASAATDFDSGIIIYGLSGSALIKAAGELNLKSCNEVFGDRLYCEDGTLMPRTNKNALIEDTGDVIRQVMQMVSSGKVRTVTGKEIPVLAETLCIHGDGKYALQFAGKIHNALKQNGVLITAPS